MKVVITESQLKRTINELFSDKLIRSTIDKFKKENPTLNINTIHFYINRFQELKDSPYIKEKDITKYSWDQLEQIIDVNQPTPQNNPNISIDNSDTVYYKDNLKIVLANSEKACVKYGTGYNFCISARGKNNKYEYYRLDGYNTIYFVIDENKSKEKLDDTFVDPTHLIVIMVSSLDNNPTYFITDANNIHDEYEDEMFFDDFNDVIKLFPRLNNLEYVFKEIEPNKIENYQYNLKIDVDNQIYNLNAQYIHTHKDKFFLFYSLDLINILNIINDIIKNDYQGFILFSYNEQQKDIQFSPIERPDWIRISGIFNDYITTLSKTNDHVEYISKLKSIILSHLNKLNKINYT